MAVNGGCGASMSYDFAIHCAPFINVIVVYTHVRQTFLHCADLFGHTSTKLQHRWMDIVEMINREPLPAVFRHIFL